MNILVGPNNSGKSTIIGAFRMLAIGLQRGRTRNPEFLPGEGRPVHRIPKESNPISLENVHTDYQDTESRVSFRLSNGAKLHFVFPPNSNECLMNAEIGEGAIANPASFKKYLPVSVLAVPVLGPLEYEEPLVSRDTVLRNLATHRASRNFRSYWYHFPDKWETFREQVEESWPGMVLQQPERVGAGNLAMFCNEDRIARETFWLGFGFQAWCQLLTHISRAKESTLLVVDEPDIYLHPDLQRQLLWMLREAGPDVVIATHSSEFVSEAEPTDLLIIERNKKSAHRVRNPGAVSAALQSIGSVHNVAITRLARSRRVLFLEGTDFGVLRKFAKKLNLPKLATGSDLATYPLGGFPTIERVRSVSDGIKATVGGPVPFAGVFDRDFRAEEQVSDFVRELRAVLDTSAILKRKELENYLLVPSCIDRAISRAQNEKVRKGGAAEETIPPARDILDTITIPMRGSLEAQYIARRGEFLKSSGKDSATVHQETMSRFERQWRDITARMEVVAGKEVLGELIGYLQRSYGINVTPSMIIQAFTLEEIPSDLATLLRQLDDFRTTTVE